MSLTINGHNITNGIDMIKDAANGASNVANTIDNADVAMAKMKQIKANKTVGIVFAIFGIVFAGIGFLIKVSQDSTLKRMTASVEADTIDVGRYRDSDGDTMYRPIFYYTVNGKKYTCESSSGSSTKPNENDATVKYNPENPSDCLSEYDATGTSLIYIIFIAIGGVFAVIGIALALSSKKASESAPMVNPNEPTPIR